MPLLRLFLKDIRASYRQYTSVVIHVFVIFVIAPLIWLAWGYAKLDFNASNQIFQNRQDAIDIYNATPPAVLFNTKNLTDKDLRNWENVYTQLSKSCKIVEASDSHNGVLVFLNNVDFKQPLISYDIHVDGISSETFTPGLSSYFLLNKYVPPPIGKQINPMEAASLKACIDDAFLTVLHNHGKENAPIFTQSVLPFLSIETRLELFVLLIVKWAYFSVSVVLLFIPAWNFVKERSTGIHLYMNLSRMAVYHRFWAYFCNLMKEIIFVIPIITSLLPFIHTKPIFFMLAAVLFFLNLVLIMYAITMASKTLPGFYLLFSSVIFGGVAFHSLCYSFTPKVGTPMALIAALFNPFSAFFFCFDNLWVCFWKENEASDDECNLYYLVLIGCMMFHIAIDALICVVLSQFFTIDGLKDWSFFWFIKWKKPPIVSEKFDPKSYANDEYAAFYELDTIMRPSDIHVQSVEKRYGCGNSVIQNASFQVAANQITLVLGAPQSGKTTLLGLLMGTVKPTAGYVHVYNKQPNPEYTSLCPKWNPLFGHLTISEHLTFYAAVSNSAISKEAIQRVMQYFSLVEYSNTQASFLNAENRRRLSIAIAFVQGNSVVLLDEPSTDEMSFPVRKALLAAISRFKNDHIVVVASNHLTDIDHVVAKIVYLGNGHIMACGFDDFLKSRFGVAYTLSVTLNCDSDEEVTDWEYHQMAVDILNIAIRYVQTASLEGPSGPTVNVILNLGKYRVFPKLFKELESKEDMLRIGRLSLKSSTLADALARHADGTVGELDEGVTPAMIDNFFNARSEIVLGCRSILLVFFGILCRKIHYIRHKFVLLIPIVVLLVAMLVLIGLQAQVLIAKENKLETSSTGTVRGYCNSSCIDVASNFTSLSEASNLSAAYTFFSRKLYKSDIKAGIVFNTNNANLSSSVIFYSPTEPHRLLAALNLIIATVGGLQPKNVDVSLVVQDVQMSGHAIRGLLQGVWVLSAIVPWMLLLPQLVDDRVTKFDKLISTLPIDTRTYWLISLVADMVIGLPIMMLLHAPFFLLYIKQLHYSHFIGGSFVFGLTFLSETHFFARIIDSKLHAVASMIFLNVIPAAFLQHSDFNILAVIWPIRYVADYVKTLILHDHYGGDHYLHDKNDYHAHMFYLGVHIVVLLGLRYSFFHLPFFVRCFHYVTFKRFLSYESLENPVTVMPKDVIEEEARVGRMLAGHSLKSNSESQEVLGTPVITMRNGRNAVLGNVTFTVPNGVCLALLAPAKAGKTSIIEAFVNPMTLKSGTIHVNNNVPFGVVLDTSIFPLGMTVYEAFAFVSRLSGASKAHNVTIAVLTLLEINEKIDDLISDCTKSEQRLIAFGIAIIANPMVLIMDEPTSGMLPYDRRRCLTILKKFCEQGASILMATESLADSEVVANKVGILSRGRLMTIGGLEDITERLASSYILWMNVKSSEANVAAGLHNALGERYQVFPLRTFGRHLIWLMRTNEERSLSWVYRDVIDFIDNTSFSSTIEKYSLSNASIASVFCSVSKGSRFSPTAD